MIWESRWLRQLRLDIPQAAQAILLQEEKFSIYFQQLSQVLEVGSTVSEPLASASLESTFLHADMSLMHTQLLAGHSVQVACYQATVPGPVVSTGLESTFLHADMSLMHTHSISYKVACYQGWTTWSVM